jgi:gluconokinase
MSAGIPLTDEDRWPWLDRIGAALADDAVHPAGLVIGCSALKKVYRDRLRAACPGLTFLFLDISREMAAARTSSRPGHFMPTTLVDSQFATLERPDAEAGVVTAAADLPVAAIVSRYLDHMKEWQT